MRRRNGAGAPTVIIEHGATSFAIEWIAVQTEIAKFTEEEFRGFLRCGFLADGSNRSYPSREVSINGLIASVLQGS
jgi:hypothetical protein